MALPHSTAGAPLAARIKSIPEDFVVREVHRIALEGQGDHAWFRVRKRDLTTKEAARRIAEALGISEREIGWAGLKDRRAITTQWMSVEHVPLEKIQALTIEGLTIEEITRHPRKLRNGKLHANDFEILARGEFDDAAIAQLERDLAQLNQRGVPNYFGEQRFGQRNVEQARRWLAEGGRAPRSKFQRKLLASALQSAIFNEVLAARVRDDSFDKALPGDVFKVRASGGVFTSEDPGDERARCARHEIDPAGPMFGPKCAAAGGDALAYETKALEALRIDPSIFEGSKLTQGTRRPLRFVPENMVLKRAPGGVHLTMRLPPGSYATEVLRELFKEGLQIGEEAERPSSTP